jgi:hypothetical protein
MKIYGSGVLTKSKPFAVVWDFEDGPCETDDQELIEQAKRRGLSIGEPPAQADAVGERDTEEPGDKTVAELKVELKELGISIPRGASKAWMRDAVSAKA